MRLTPSWFRSSSDAPSEERSEDTSSHSGVTIYHSPQSDFSRGAAEDDGQAAALVPDSDAALLALLDEMDTPVTVDKVTDKVVEPTRPPIETWATVHERLHQHRLPTLAASGEIEFDQTEGLVERSASRSSERTFSQTVLGTVSIGMLFVILVFVSASALLALTVTLLTTTLAVWFVPSVV